MQPAPVSYLYQDNFPCLWYNIVNFLHYILLFLFKFYGVFI